MARAIQVIMGQEFIEHLIDMGVLPSLVTDVEIRAELNQPVTITYTRLLDTTEFTLDDIAGGIRKPEPGEDPGVAH